jgi:hypothetical protein
VVKTYQGYFLEDGRLMTNGSAIRMPTTHQVIVNILDDKVEEPIAKLDPSVHRRQVSAVKKFLAAVADLKDEDSVLTDDDWDEMANLRAGTNAGMSRRVEL